MRVSGPRTPFGGLSGVGQGLLQSVLVQGVPFAVGQVSGCSRLQDGLRQGDPMPRRRASIAAWISAAAAGEVRRNRQRDALISGQLLELEQRLLTYERQQADQPSVMTRLPGSTLPATNGPSLAVDALASTAIRFRSPDRSALRRRHRPHLRPGQPDPARRRPRRAVGRHRKDATNTHARQNKERRTA